MHVPGYCSRALNSCTRHPAVCTSGAASTSRTVIRDTEMVGLQWRAVVVLLPVVGTFASLFLLVIMDY